MTNLLYMTDSYLFEATGEIASISLHEDGRTILVLNQTIFYPQGGGQRFDIGTISSEKAVFKVEEVRFAEGDVLHIGAYESVEFSVGETVALKVDKERRILHSKLQSAGHLIDMAMRHVGYGHLTPAKGAHYPEWSEVEYEGELPAEEIESATKKIQQDLDQMIEKGYEVKVEMSSKEEAMQKCYTLPPALPENKPIRIVAVWEDLYMPCGGTHVKNVAELHGLTITRVKSKKGITKISYEIKQ